MRITRTLLVALTAGLFAAAPAVAEMLSGELVRLGEGNRFRLVGHDGTFTAPAGTPLEQLDGRAVTVEVSGGRVVQISDRPVAITPIVSGFETVRGQLVVRDPVAGSFNFASDSRVYIAPASIDIAPYGGKWVEVTLDARGEVTALKLIAAPSEPLGAPAAPPAAVPPAPPAEPIVGSPSMPQPDAVVSGAATCRVGDATVASGSTVCRAGTTAMCNNGTWVSLGTACR